MNNNRELTTKDKQFLDAYDISMFKSAVAYIQNNRHTSCQSGVADRKSPIVSKCKHLKEAEPPLLPIESRIANMCKKYSSESRAVAGVPIEKHKYQLKEFNDSITSSLANLDIKDNKKFWHKSEVGTSKAEHAKFSPPIRRKSQVFSPFEEENAIHNKGAEDKNSRRKNFRKREKYLDDFQEYIETSDMSMQTCENYEIN